MWDRPLTLSFVIEAYPSSNKPWMQSACFPSDSYYFNTKSNGSRKLETGIVRLLTCVCKCIVTIGTVVQTFVSAFVLRSFLKLMNDSLIFSLGCGGWGFAHLPSLAPLEEQGIPEQDARCIPTDHTIEASLGSPFQISLISHRKKIIAAAAKKKIQFCHPEAQVSFLFDTYVWLLSACK